ncbi:MAG: sulfur carrier protein ThiS adenylyltransferase ThiF [Candidatus Eisenbacteria bacterium]|nr:sulfur carrier protein ThiS adenylyltransferase ThiF [Candidatus Eisenbacteria bacterium]
MDDRSHALQRFARNVPGMTARLSAATIGIAGCGGLGSNIAVALARAGVGQLILVDRDRVSLSDLNRQHYFESDLGRPKVAALGDHLRGIHPAIRLTAAQEELQPADVAQRFADAELLVEAFDDAAAKAWLIEAWSAAFPERPIVAASGIGGYGRTADLRVRRAGRIHVCGDEASDQSLGLCAARVAIVANMQANVAIELLMDTAADPD